MHSLVIFVPDRLKTMKEPGYLVGYVENIKDNISIYVLDKIANSSLNNHELKIIGFDYVDNFKYDTKLHSADYMTIYHSNDIAWHICLLDIHVRNSTSLFHLKPVIIYYNYDAFLYSYIDNNSGWDVEEFVKPHDHFMMLSELIKMKENIDDEHNKKENITFIISIKKIAVAIFFVLLVKISITIDYISFIGKYSVFIRNLKECIDGILDVREKGTKLQQFSLFITLLTDVVVGCFILWQMKDIYQPVGPLLDGAEYIVMYLRELLNNLMGSPVGLKLNRAFNTILGKCFLYHIELWWIFLVQLSPWICHGFNILLSLGTFGLSFQAAMLCDIISLTTFHVHCIYVYAAKLYNIQMNGLKALCRLFLGRKYNPLRDRVDSCSYNNRQLFIGTLGFTIFLFLLPTTTLYYVVFTMLRILMLLILEILDWTREILHSLPIYTTVLWLLGSIAVPSTAHVVLESSLNCIHATTQPLSPLQHHWLIPAPIKHIHGMQWSGIFGKIINGDLLTQF